MKKIKMLLYGEPGVGKSVFASKAPKPFFITTDGNYEWLEDFGAKPEDHIQVSSWAESKEAFKLPLEKYETIVVDLLEDMFKWDEQEFCIKNKIDHIGDLGYGKGYDLTRTDFFIEIAKLLGRDKHIILITHGITYTVKDRRGVEKTHYGPSSRIPDKVLDMIEGRVRYCLRCYMKAEEQQDGTIAKKRYLSLVPKENEFAIARGIDENTVPHDIPLDFSEFMKWIGLGTKNQSTDDEIDKPIPEAIIEEPQHEKETKQLEIQLDEDVKLQQEQMAEENRSDNNVKEQIESEPNDAPWIPDEAPKVEQVVEEPVKQPEPVKVEPISNNDKLAAIRAKIAAAKLKNQNN